MLIYDENRNLIDSEEIKKEIDIDSVEVPTEEELEMLLGENFLNTEKTYLKGFGLAPTFTPIIGGGIDKRKIGKKILAELKKMICTILEEVSDVNKVIDEVLKALAVILPGGIIIKFIVEKIVAFIVKRGIGAFCLVE